ncbi:MAG TPA: Rv3235 family protein, partial [Cellulomonas sp.]
TAAESAIVGIASVLDALAVDARAAQTPAAETPVLGRPSAPAPAPAPDDDARLSEALTPASRAGNEPPTDRSGLRAERPTNGSGRRAESRAPVRPRLVPALGPLQRLSAPTGPGHSRPATLDERVLARRRAALAAERAAATAESAVGPAPTSDPTSVCCSLVLAAVESLAGIRAVAQLARWVTPEVYEALSTRAALTVRVLGAGAASRRPEVRRVRVCRIGEHVAEASIVIDDGRRVRAVAVRLESWRGAWRAVALEIG